MKFKKNKIIKIVLSIILGLVLALVALPFVFKTELLNKLKEKANTYTDVTIDFHDADISFWRSFPDVRITIDSLSLVGKDNFEDVVLYRAPETVVDLDISSFFGDNKIPRINQVSIQSPKIHIIILDSILTNYNILLDKSSEKSQFVLELTKYDITDGDLIYHDNTLGLYTELKGVTHKGRGDFTQDVFDLMTETQVKTLLLKYQGTSYFSKASADLKAGFKMDFLENKYSFLDNIFTLNDLNGKFDGFVQLTGDDIITDITFSTETESFKSLMSLMPNTYTDSYKDIKSSGFASFSGKVKGTYNEIKNIMPGFDIALKVRDGYIKYPSLPKEIKNVNADFQIKALRPDYRDLEMNIPNFSMTLGQNNFKGSLKVQNMTGNQKVSGNINGKISLSDIKDAYPIQDIETLTGIIDGNLKFDAKMSDINSENYSTIMFDGIIDASNILYKTKNNPSIAIGKIHSTAKPSQIKIESSDIKLGKSDLNFSADIRNPLAVFSTDKAVEMQIFSTSTLLDLNEWMAAPTTSSSPTNPMSIPNDQLNKSNVSVDFSAKNILFNEYDLENVAMEAKIALNAVDVKKFTVKIGESDIHVDGTVVNAYDYLFNNGLLEGNIHLSSNVLNMNQFMTSSASNTNSVDSIISVPEKIKLAMSADIKRLIYTNLNLTNFKGNLEVANSEVALHNLETNSLGGKFMLEGIYSTKNLTNPDFAIKLDLSKISFGEAFSKIEMFNKIAPIASYINGIFNTTIVLRGKLGQNMTPDLSTLDASGLIETLNGAIKGFNPFSELAKKIGVDEIKEFSLANTKNWFEILNGFVEIKPFNKKIKDIDITVSGRHGIGKEMDYNIDLEIPRALLNKNKLTAAAETGWSNIEKEAAKLGLDVNQGNTIFLNVKMTGQLKKPVFKITPKTSKGTGIGNQIQDKAGDVIKSVQDSLKSEILKREEELKDSITKRVNQELDKLKSQAEKTIDSAVDSIKSKAKDVLIDRLDSLTKGAVSDSLRQKAKDVLNNKSSEDVDKIKEKLKEFNPFKKKKNN